MVCLSDLFHDMANLSSPTQISLLDGSFQLVCHTGTVFLTPHIKLQNVLICDSIQA